MIVATSYGCWFIRIFLMLYFVFVEGEDIGDAAIREVFEETNIKSEFQFLISLRHTHIGMFDCSDIYFVVGLKPLSEEIVKCSREIAVCEWMKVLLQDEFMHMDRSLR